MAGQLVLLEDGSKLVGTFVWLTVPVLVFADHLGGESRGTASRARATAGSSDVP